MERVYKILVLDRQIYKPTCVPARLLTEHKINDHDARDSTSPHTRLPSPPPTPRSGIVVHHLKGLVMSDFKCPGGGATKTEKNK